MLAVLPMVLLLLSEAPVVVRASDGVLAEGYEAGRACTAERRICAGYVIELETRAVVMFDGEWASGFRETGRGQEVRKLPQPPVRQPDR